MSFLKFFDQINSCQFAGRECRNFRGKAALGFLLEEFQPKSCCKSETATWNWMAHDAFVHERDIETNRY